MEAFDRARTRWLLPALLFAALGVSSLAGGPEAPTAQAAQQSPAGSPMPTPTLMPGVRAATVTRGGQQYQTRVFEQETAPNGQPMRAGSVLVKFRPGVSQTARAASHQQANGEAVEALRVPDTVACRSRRAVSRVRSRLIVRGQMSSLPSPTTSCARGSSPTTRASLSSGACAKSQCPAAWDVSRGAPSVPIAIVDCGIYNESSRVVSPDGRTGHPDMRGKVTREQNFSPSPDTDDFCNHGIHVAGIAAASTNNAVGVAGVGFDAALLNAKVLDDLGGGTDQSVAQGISWAADNGARVISMSLGRPGACGGTVQAAIDSAWSRGAVIVVAAGNDGYIGATAPGNCNHVLSAAATDSQDGVAPFSNYGPSIPVGAPGVGILSSNNTGDTKASAVRRWPRRTLPGWRR